jgi:hypothetical protein
VSASELFSSAFIRFLSVANSLPGILAELEHLVTSVSDEEKRIGEERFVVQSEYMGPGDIAGEVPNFAPGWPPNAHSRLDG